jgi:putative ABC transport system ATP-binding protein
VALVIVTHDAEVAARAGRQITMQDGRVLSDLGQFDRR